MPEENPAGQKPSLKNDVKKAFKDIFGGSGDKDISSMNGFFLTALIFHYLDLFIFLNIPLFRVFAYTIFSLVYLPFFLFSDLSGSDRVRACSKYWVILAITFLLPYASVFTFLNSIPGLYMFLTTLSGVILIWFPPLPLYILFAHSNRLSFGRGLVIGLIIFWIFAAFSGVGPIQASPYFKESFLNRIPTVNIVQGARQLPMRAAEGYGHIADSLQKYNFQKWWDKQLQIATGEYYVGKVDQNADEKIGVYLEGIQPADKFFYENDTIMVWGTLTARTIDDKPITVFTACQSGEYLGDMTPNDPNTITEIFSIDSYERQDLLCVIPGMRENASEDPAVDIFAKFNFTTLSYLKTYYIDRDRQRALTRDGVDVFDQYGLEKSPLAVYTNGPVSIGMQATQPLTGLYLHPQPPQEENRPFKLGVTVENRWFGRVINMTSLEIQMPDTFSIVPGSCDREMLKKGMAEGYAIYYFDDDALKSIEQFDDFETFSCMIQVDDVEKTLGANPVVTKYFRLTVGYEYELKESIIVDIRKRGDLP